jgi:hypothetical protein
VLIASTLDQFDSETAFTQVATYSERDDWGSVELDGIVANDIGAYPRLVVLGDRGEIWTVVDDGWDKAQLPDAGITGRALGATNAIAEIAGSLYVCGYAGQVYVRERGQWVHRDDGLVEKKAVPTSLALESIDGTAWNDIYTVGSRGQVFRYDGKKWSRIDVLTNVDLDRIRCLRRDWIVAVGDRGTFIESDGKKWRVEQIPGCDAHLWDIALFGDDLYAAAGKTLYRRDAKTKVWADVRHGLRGKTIGFDRFALGGGRLWAISSKRLSSFDGKKWETHPDPDNG